MKKKILLLTMMLSVGMLAGCNQADDKNDAKQTQGEVSEEAAKAETEKEKDTEQNDAQMQDTENTESENDASEAQTETDKLQQDFPLLMWQIRNFISAVAQAAGLLCFILMKMEHLREIFMIVRWG